jgi:ABC-type transport system involved in cytochrome c biogenesis permease subunit
VAASSGRYWGWDPKEVWSLVAFPYMAISRAAERFISISAWPPGGHAFQTI